MSSLWYEYLEESGGEVIPSIYFPHIKRGSKKIENCDFNALKNIAISNYVLALEDKDHKWCPFKIIKLLSEGWLNIMFYNAETGIKKESKKWIDIDSNNVKSTHWCYENSKTFSVVLDDVLLESMNKYQSETFTIPKTQFLWETIKVGGYMECWVEGVIGTVWPVKVLENIGGRLKLTWFGTALNEPFYRYFLHHHLRPLGWAKDHNWRYNPPRNRGINISINNSDTFVRGSPSAIRRDLLGPNQPIECHCLEVGWLLEAVDPREPFRIRPARVEAILDEYYYQVRFLEGHKDSFISFRGLGIVIPANLTGINGIRLTSQANWDVLLGEECFAPHTEYFQPTTAAAGDNSGEDDSNFLPGCKLEAVHPNKPDVIMPATITKCLEGSRLIWIHLDSDPSYPDYLVDPQTCCDILPAGWCEMNNHKLILPTAYAPLKSLEINSNLLPFDCTEMSIYFQPFCSLGPFLSRSSAIEILPKRIGPGLLFPVLREMFILLLRVSHKPFKLMRLLQLDSPNEKRDLMATIAIPAPKSESSSNNSNTTTNSMSANGNSFMNFDSNNRQQKSVRVPIYSSLWNISNNGKAGGSTSSSNTKNANNSYSFDPNTGTINHLPPRFAEWLVEVPVRLRALPEFCRQISLGLGACPSFITSAVEPTPNIQDGDGVSHSFFDNIVNEIGNSGLSDAQRLSMCHLHCSTRYQKSTAANNASSSTTSTTTTTTNAPQTQKLTHKSSTSSTTNGSVQTRRKRLLQRPLLALGYSYRDLKIRLENTTSHNKSSSSEDEEGDEEDNGNNGEDDSEEGANKVRKKPQISGVRTRGANRNSGASQAGGFTKKRQPIVRRKRSIAAVYTGDNKEELNAEDSGGCDRVAHVKTEKREPSTSKSTEIESTKQKITSKSIKPDKKQEPIQDPKPEITKIPIQNPEDEDLSSSDCTIPNDNLRRNEEDFLEHENHPRQIDDLVNEEFNTPTHINYSAPPTLVNNSNLINNPTPDQLDQLTFNYSIDPLFLAGEIDQINLPSNPVEWNVEDVARYFQQTNDCCQLSDWLISEGVDGRALLLLTLPAVSSTLQLDPAIRLCRHVASLKRAFVEQFADQDQLLPF